VLRVREMFLIADYFQVLFVYLIIGLLLWIPPLIPQWKLLVNWFNKKQTKHKKMLEIVFIALSLFIITISFVLISFFNTNIIT